MTRADLDSSVRQVVGTALGRPVPGDEPLSRTSDARWDSLKHVEILFALEDAFDVRFSEDEMSALESLDALVDAIERHRAA